MRSWIALVCAVAGFIAGFAFGGALVGTSDTTVPRRELEAVQRKLDEATARAERAEQAVAAPERRPARSPAAASKPPADGAPKAPPPDSDREARVRDLVAKSAESFEAGDGAGLLEILRSLADLPPEGRAAAMDLALRIQEDIRGAQALGIDEVSFHSTLADAGPSELLVWSLANPSPPAFRALAAWSLPWVVPREQAIASMTVALVEDSDVGVQQALVASLGKLRDSRVDAALGAIFRDRTREPALRRRIPFALAQSSDPEVVGLLTTAVAEDPDESVRHAARCALQIANPPADGYALTVVYPDGAGAAAGLQPGDVVVTYEGHPVKTTEAFLEAIETARASTEVATLEIIRDGHEIQVPVRRGRLGVQGRAVRKR